MNQRTLEKLEWPRLLSKLESFCQTDEGKELSLCLVPKLTQDEVKIRWNLVSSLKSLVNQGYRAPIGPLTPLSHIFRSASLGQMLEGLELRDVLSLLNAVEKVYSFVTDFSERCTTLAKVGSQIYPLPKLSASISKAINPDGILFDDASQELSDIRRNRRNLRKKIETELQTMLNGTEFGPYLQDDFFTIRSERYVVPIRLDGRGRIKGSILDTSASGQTLYIEPAAISPMNEQIQELDLAEKLEIIKIFRTLSTMVTSELTILKTNYQQLVELDFLSAQAELAVALKAGPVKFTDTTAIDLKDARHPLITRPDGKPAVGNNIEVGGEHKSLIISGPNAGGKTVILETLGILHLMVKAGLLIPAHEDSKVYFFKTIFIEMGDAQDLSANLSTFSGHVLGLKNILDVATAKDLILLDELAVGTEPETGSAIAQAILESLAERGSISVSTTHYDNLKGLAVSNSKFRNGSMEYSVRSLKPTYKLILDVPGQSYGLEVAEDMGLSHDIIARAKDLRGHTASSLDAAVSQLTAAKEQTYELQRDLEKQILEAKSEKNHWESEKDATANARKKAAKILAERYDDELRSLKADFDKITKEIRKTNKEVEKSGTNQDTSELKRSAEGKISEYDKKLNSLNQEFQSSDDLPGNQAEFGKLKTRVRVFLTPLGKEGTISKLGANENDPIEVEVGALKMRVSIRDLRVLPTVESASANKKANKKSVDKLAAFAKIAKTLHPGKSGQQNSKSNQKKTGELVIQSSRNTCDLRGLDLDDAKAKTWSYIDAAVLRGEYALIVIHGHGTDRLKSGIRDALENESPYELTFRAGMDQEGGNGVTIVILKP